MEIDNSNRMRASSSGAASSEQAEESVQTEGRRRVVAELDVCLDDVDTLLRSSQVMGEKNVETRRQREHPFSEAKGKDWRQVMMLQYPLRPQERPYPMQDVRDVRVKPQVQRIEVDVPIFTDSHNYEDRQCKQISSLTLRSSNVNLHTKCMLGVLKDGKLTLVPLDKAVQLRPKSFLDQPEAPVSNVIKQQVQQQDGLIGVRIERHETKKQIEARQRSHAYQREMEELEPWLPLSASATGSAKAKKVREEWAKKPSDMSMGVDESANSESAASYLDRLLARNQDEIV
jgi:hypothetical protein